MNWDDDDDDFDFPNFDDLSEEEKEELEKEEKERESRMRNHPLFIKANEIYEVVTALIASMDDQDKERQESTLLESAMMLSPKLAGAIGSDSWLICMQNASIIRYHAEYLLTATSGMKMFGKTDEDYIKVMRNEILEFQKLFREWVESFDTMEHEEYIDEWGLFIRK